MVKTARGKGAHSGWRNSFAFAIRHTYRLVNNIFLLEEREGLQGQQKLGAKVIFYSRREEILFSSRSGNMARCTQDREKEDGKVAEKRRDEVQLQLTAHSSLSAPLFLFLCFSLGSISVCELRFGHISHSSLDLLRLSCFSPLRRLHLFSRYEKQQQQRQRRSSGGGTRVSD